jgi:tryptophan halogenase
MKFVVCGGGTAGWISAFTIHASNPNVHEVVVIESESIGIIGAGEATSGFLYDLLDGATLFNNNEFLNPNRIKFDFNDFVEKVDAVPKYALKHINWAKEKSSYWAPINGSETSKRSPDHLFNYVVAEFGPEKAYLSSSIGQAYDLNKMPPQGGYGFQFNAPKVAKYFREHITKTTKTSHINSTIKNVNISSNGIVESVVLENDEVITGDFFIDATGFHKLLANKLNIGWIDYKDQLIVDRAMPFLVPYKEGEDKVQPVTVAEALSSGWMWRTPTGGRRGCGYVYSSAFISEDEAQAEAEKIMGHPIEPIKHIKYESGRLEEFWKGNVLVVGLASSFIEPLEATSIHATIMQLFTFCQEYLSSTKEKTLNPASIEKYNAKTSKMYEYYKDFTVFHYQGGREDSEFWKTIKFEKITSPAVENYIERAKSRIPSVMHFMDFWGVDALWKWTLAGLGHITREQAMEELLQFQQFEYAQGHYQSFRNEMRRVLEDRPAFEISVKNSI